MPQAERTGFSCRTVCMAPTNAVGDDPRSGKTPAHLCMAQTLAHTTHPPVAQARGSPLLWPPVQLSLLLPWLLLGRLSAPDSQPHHLLPPLQQTQLHLQQPVPQRQLRLTASACVAPHPLLPAAVKLSGAPPHSADAGSDPAAALRPPSLQLLHLGSGTCPGGWYLPLGHSPSCGNFCDPPKHQCTQWWGFFEGAYPRSCSRHLLLPVALLLLVTPPGVCG